MSHRPEQTAEQITHLAAQYLSREAGRETLLTATRTDLSLNGKIANIYISVFPAEHSERALGFLGRHEQPFRDYLKKEGRFAVLPFIHFIIDPGAENLQRLEELGRDA